MIPRLLEPPQPDVEGRGPRHHAAHVLSEGIALGGGDGEDQGQVRADEIDRRIVRPPERPDRLVWQREQMNDGEMVDAVHAHVRKPAAFSITRTPWT